MHDNSRDANLLGAAALSIADRLVVTAAEAAGVSASGAAALVTLAAYPGLGVTELGQRIGLSQPASARMVDALVARELVERRPGASGRAVEVHPTAAGSTAARQVLHARAGELSRVVGRLNPQQREALTRGLEPLLDALFDEIGSEHVVCRLCDRHACLREDTFCPVGQAARERGGTSRG